MAPMFTVPVLFLRDLGSVLKFSFVERTNKFHDFDDIFILYKRKRSQNQVEVKRIH